MRFLFEFAIRMCVFYVYVYTHMCYAGSAYDSFGGLTNELGNVI